MTDPKTPSRTATIAFNVGLDADHMPVAIEWEATDSPGATPRETKSVMLSVWNSEEKKAMRIDLWTDDMLVDEMKLFVYQTLVTMADTFERATSEGALANEMRAFADQLAEKMGFVQADE